MAVGCRISGGKVSGVQLDLSVVVPVYNNGTTLKRLLERLIAVLDSTGLSFEIIFVDDGSTDDGPVLLEREARADDRIRLYRLSRNFGSQSALCAGFDLVRGTRTVCLDADLENLPEDIPPLLAALDRGFDLACGVRENRRSSWLGRQLPSALLNAYVRRRTGTAVRDIGCGMRAMDSHVVRNLGLEGEARRLLTPLLLRRARAVVEVPIRHEVGPARDGHSPTTLLGIALDFYLMNARRPFLLGGMVSALLLGVGLVTLPAGAIVGIAGLSLFGLAAMIVGFVGGLVSLVGEYAQRIYQLEQGLPFYELRATDGETTPHVVATPKTSVKAGTDQENER